MVKNSKTAAAASDDRNPRQISMVVAKSRISAQNHISGALYGNDGSSLHTIDKTTGEAADLAEIGSFTGLAFAPLSDAPYTYLPLVLSSPPVPESRVIRVSVNSQAQQGNGLSGNGTSQLSISENGRFVAFSSDASNLTAGDNNGYSDVFVHDWWTGRTEMISLSCNGIQGNNWSIEPSISGDGRYVAFRSLASNLISMDTNETSDIFVHDRYTSETERVSMSSDGLEANYYSISPSISGDGRYIAYASGASNLVDSDTNNAVDIFVFDQDTSETYRASVSSSGDQGNHVSQDPDISRDGRFIVFTSTSSNLTVLDDNFNCFWPDYNLNCPDVFLHDRMSGQTIMVSVSSGGVQGNNMSGNNVISPDGRYITYYSNSTNLLSSDRDQSGDVYIHDAWTGATSLVSINSSGDKGNGFSAWPSISESGRLITSSSLATNLVTSDSNGFQDIFVHDFETKDARRISITNFDEEANGMSQVSFVSDDGCYIAFSSDASNLVADDTNSVQDVFLYYLGESCSSN